MLASSQPLGSGRMFDRIAPRYDALNRILSLGMDLGWRRAAVAAVGLRAGEAALDVATGTADLAIALASATPGARIVGLDPSAAMLALGARKITQGGLGARVACTRGDAQALPFPAGSFAGATIAFGIRNVPDRARALREMTRVVRPGGRVVVLELNEVQSGLLAPAVRLWTRRVVPRIGAWLSGAREYRYLQESVAVFPPADEFAALMRASGLAVRSVRPLGFGACTLFVGEVEPPA